MWIVLTFSERTPRGLDIRGIHVQDMMALPGEPAAQFNLKRVATVVVDEQPHGKESLDGLQLRMSP